MARTTLDEQLTSYLTDVHSIEQQALAQMRTAPQIAGDEQLASAFSQHLDETREHERRVRERLRARHATPATAKDLLGMLTGMGFVAFARAQPDTPGKLTAHGFSYEHMELAAYELLRRLAERAGDQETVQMAAANAGEERRMGDRLAELFDRAAEASLRHVDPSALGDQLDKYLADAHAIEAQSLQLLAKAPSMAGDGELAAIYERHLAQTREHARLVAERLHARAASPSKVKDAVLRLGALNWGVFFRVQPDTPAKLAAFAYAFEHLELAGYELLRRVAERAQDPATAALAQRIGAEERAAAEEVHARFDDALDASLHEHGLAAADAVES